jgi:hypothetical protein
MMSDSVAAAAGHIVKARELRAAISQGPRRMSWPLPAATERQTPQVVSSS